MKAFVIYLPSREHSVVHSNYMIDYLKGVGIDAEKFEGTPGDHGVAMAAKSKKVLYPYSIKNRILGDEEVKNLIKPELYEDFKQRYSYHILEKQFISEEKKAKLSRPGVVGCFYSHYRLWQKCLDLDEPIMIFEDDVKFYRGYHPVSFDGVLILSLGKKSFLSSPGKDYLEDPTGAPEAKQWNNFSMPGASGYAITPNAAKSLVKFYKPYWYPADNAINQFVCKIQIHNYIMGRNTTTEEGNTSSVSTKDWE